MMTRLILHLAGFLGALWLPLAGAPLNVLLFTADDLGYELMDPARKPDLDLTPHLDRFASQGMQFRHAHVNAAKLPAPDGVDGRSVVGLLKGEKQAGREYVFTRIDYKHGGPATPMRCVQDRTHLYVFNSWSRAGAHYRNANEGLSMRGRLRRWMGSTKDPVLPMFDCRHDSVELGKALKRFPSKQSLRPR